jgi:glucan phosphoethanolaminetransferase (alkaline phosphatase superfamily)
MVGSSETHEAPRQPRLMLYYLLVFVASYVFLFVLLWLSSSKRHSLLPLSGVAVLAGLLAVYAVFLFHKKG